jgi:glycerol-3-phosphate dehydrogenase
MREPGWFDVAGGKLTTYRHMAEQTVDQVARRLGRSLAPSRTAEDPLEAGPFSRVLPPPVSEEVVAECCRREWAVHLDDVLLRRTSWHFYHPNQRQIAELAAGWMAEPMGWDRRRQAAELERYYSLADSIHDPQPMPCAS